MVLLALLVLGVKKCDTKAAGDIGEVAGGEAEGEAKDVEKEEDGDGLRLVRFVAGRRGEV